MPFRGLTMLKSRKLVIKGGLCYRFAMVNSSQYVYAISISNFLCLICFVKYKCFLKNFQIFVLLKGIGESQVCQGDHVGQISKETFCQTRYPKYPCLGSFGSLGSLGIYITRWQQVNIF